MIFAQTLEIVALSDLASVLCARKFSFAPRGVDLKLPPFHFYLLLSFYYLFIIIFKALRLVAAFFMCVFFYLAAAERPQHCALVFIWLLFFLFLLFYIRFVCCCIFRGFHLSIVVVNYGLSTICLFHIMFHNSLLRFYMFMLLFGASSTVHICLFLSFFIFKDVPVKLGNKVMLSRPGARAVEYAY